MRTILSAVLILAALSACTNPNNPSPQAGGGSSAAAMIYGSMLYNEAILPQPQPSYGYITCSHGQYSSLCSVR